MTLMGKLSKPKAYLVTFLKWGLFGLLIGAWGGLLGAAFHHALHFVTHLRAEHNWLIFFLPVAGLLSVGIYTLFRQRSNRGTNEVIDAVLSGGDVSAKVAPTIFLATAVTHLFGGSAGREGAALQIGGSTATLISRILRLESRDRRVLIMSGMSAVFAGLFGTPLTATLFCMEFVSVGTLFSPALLPCYFAAFTASKVSGLLGVHAEGLLLEAVTADCEAGRMVQDFDYHRTVSAEHGHMAYLRINVAGSGDFMIEVWEDAVLTCKWLKENLSD